ncbi:rhomboid family intramembrane serine protease [Schleiferilactobacillus perolens]|uniref:rhomboid family intramembrane serine protease n=1 Tax=Schleiferilactobacillus perolens TaxID=100468 RepID=UPI0023532214|nr:rhomboid family intramembrane serine protease [Schleiferilactobacillus perolens]MCI2171872.1 rhomboid family intramembrane serine protease [Schleiferilactobacillus perolens]
MNNTQWRYYMTRLKLMPFVTYILLILTALMFVAESLLGGSTNSETLATVGANYGPFVANGEWWRLISAMFIHIGFLHIATNGVMIYAVGTQIEQLFGHWRTLVIYLGSGILGNLTSFALGRMNTLSAGASTALFGLFGAFLMLGVSYRQEPYFQMAGRQFATLIILNLVIDIVMPQVDIWGHIGGAIGGYLLGMGLALPARYGKLPWWQRILGIAVTVVAAAVLYTLGMSRYGG